MSAEKFNTERANDYLTQSRIALAGYDACHELTACILSASLSGMAEAEVLVAGAGGGASEIVNAAKLEASWRFTAVDPSKPMMDITVDSLVRAGLMDRTNIVLGVVEDLPPTQRFDAATLIGVLHHLPGDEAKISVLSAIALRLRRGAPLVVAGNRSAYRQKPLLLSAWAQRWRMQGASAAEVKAKLAKIREGADPPPSDEAVADLLAASGFAQPELFFSSLFWGAWVAVKL